MSFAVNHLVGFGARRATSAGIMSEYLHSASAGAGTTSTFSACNLGTATADRLIVVIVTSAGGPIRSISSITIGGNSATLHVQSNASNGAQGVGIASLVVPSGTSADVVVTWSASSSNTGLMVFALKGYSNATPYDTDATTNGTAYSTSQTATIDTVNGGVLIAASEHFVNETMSWSSLTEDNDFQVNSTTMRMSGGRKSLTSTASGVTETCSWATSIHGCIAAGVWQ